MHEMKIHRRCAEEPARAEKKYRSIFENAVDGIYQISPEGRFTTANPAMARMLGYESPEELMTSISDVERQLYVVPERCSRLKSLLGKREVVRGFESQVYRKDGSKIWISQNVRAVNNGNAGLAHFEGTAEDITERKRMEEELFRVRKLESISILAGGIAHDFNNILTGMMGYISLAKLKVDAQNGSSVIQRLIEAEKACLRARDLTRQLLTFSRGGAPVKKPGSIVGLLKDLVSTALEGSPVRSQLSISEHLWLTEMDERQIGQVIVNLVANAVRAMPGGGAIEVSAENVEANAQHGVPLGEKNYVKVSVKDYGTGITEENLQKIFDPYFTTRRMGSQKGIGLGLAIAYSIIKDHDGFITAESELGKGSTFAFYLPAFHGEAPIKTAMEERSMNGRPKILVMDDEPAIRDMMCDMLAELGYDLELAKDGGEAIELYRRAKVSGQPFDAVVMDLVVPNGMGGEEALRTLIQIDPDVKAIVSSGYYDDPVMADFRRYGFRGVIAKPYKIEELGSVLHAVICCK